MVRRGRKPGPSKAEAIGKRPKNTAHPGRYRANCQVILLAVALMLAIFIMPDGGGWSAARPDPGPVAVAVFTSNAQIIGDDPVIFIAFLCLFIWFIWLVTSISRDEPRLNARGETHFPGHKRFDRREIRARTDRALLAGIRGLVDGDEPLEVVGRLHEATHRGDALPDGRARQCYDVAVERLEVAAGRCRILEWEARLRALEEGGRWLCMARAEYLREMIG